LRWHIAETAKRLAIDEADEAEEALYNWRSIARHAQVAPEGEWLSWLYLAGRGAGKTRSGAEWVREQIESGKCRRMALVAATAADCRDTLVEGDAGLLEVCPPWNMPTYEPSKRRVTWPNGARAILYSAETPRQLRGPAHDGAWCDELSAWKYPETFDMLQLGLRKKGSETRCMITTTPRPIKLLKDLIALVSTVVTSESTYDNLDNLAPQFRERILTQYEGTRLGRQELYAEILEDIEGALWTYDMIDALRVTETPTLTRIAVGIDPAMTAKEQSDDTGIVAAGIAKVGDKLHGFVLDDWTIKDTPEGWARKALALLEMHGGNYIVAEVNAGGDMVAYTIHTINPNVKVKQVRASKGKVARAEPISALYEQGRIHHVGVHAKLEDQLCNWQPGMKSPDRLDAMVWVLTDLMLNTKGSPILMT